MDGRFRISKHFSMLDIQMFRMHENDNHRMNAHQLIQIVVFSTFYQTKIESKFSEYPRWSQYSKHKSTTNPHHPPLSLWRCCALMSWTMFYSLYRADFLQKCQNLCKKNLMWLCMRITVNLHGTQWAHGYLLSQLQHVTASAKDSIFNLGWPHWMGEQIENDMPFLRCIFYTETFQHIIIMYEQFFQICT